MTKDNGRLSPKGAKIVAALTKFCDTLDAGGRIEDHFTVRTVNLNLEPQEYSPEDVKRVRRLLGLSQPLFARFLGVGVKTVRSWEQGARKLSPMARRFLDELTADPEHYRKRFQGMITVKSSQPV